MRFQHLTAWSGPGNLSADAGDIVDAKPEWGPMPLTAKCLDQEAYDAMMAWYSPLLGSNFIHQFHCAPGIDSTLSPYYQHPAPQSEVHSAPPPPPPPKGRYELREPWPITQGFCIEAGEILDARDWTWHGMALPWPPPLCVKCLSQSAADAMF